MPEDDVVWYERVVFEDAMLRGHFSFRGALMSWTDGMLALSRSGHLQDVCCHFHVIPMAFPCHFHVISMSFPIFECDSFMLFQHLSVTGTSLVKHTLEEVSREEGQPGDWKLRVGFWIWEIAEIGRNMIPKTKNMVMLSCRGGARV